ncbi:Alpha-L-fucosidase 1 [Apostasia shenzhenica]|uniref:alpha-L-fucosidase n=1 Tax=Apostasia shenzhenica TaxID=1088818 RepID=A0A2H9ZWP5_9ASPA|nr:Alpha-L-fucosidase 1 [Apostasia shenzhenica]
MSHSILFLFIFLQQFAFSLSKLPTPPLPVLPIPTAAQLKWQRREIIFFFHFGINTFTGSEWGSGHESPSLFNPSSLNASQWISAAEAAGASLAILTAKHHDGFCLWPSRYTHHSVARSPWKNGAGDVVAEFVRAARAAGVDVGLYLSPWDRHERSYGLEVPYNEYYLGQLHELLTQYGRISEIWFDGAKGANATNMNYYFEEWFAVTKQLQSSINIFSDAGPDVRWVGDEKGDAGETCWSLIDRKKLRMGDASLESYLNSGDQQGADWVPPECDVSIRPGWFWHKSQSPKPLSKLLDIYYNSVGRNCVLLLNVPPNSTGLVAGEDLRRLREFRWAIDRIFKEDLAMGSKAKGSSQRGGKEGGFAASNVLDGDEETYWSPEEEEEKDGEYWIELRRKNATSKFNVVRIQEAIAMGQRIERHEVVVDGKVMVARGTTVGHKRLHRLDQPVRGKKVRIRIVGSRGPPLISAVGLHFDPFK